jgi:small nuclear ribonucleoprotein (snRNP)-like protein
MDKCEARDYLAGFLNENLRIMTTDGRMFRGAFKCTDPDQNVVLAQTYEYRQPSAQQRAEAAGKTAGGTVTLDMTSRYLGLVVVPGQHIVKMEVEKFASQMRNTMANAI